MHPQTPHGPYLETLSEGLGGDTIFEMPAMRQLASGRLRPLAAAADPLGRVQVEVGLEPSYTADGRRQHVHLRLTRMDPAPLGVDVVIEIGGVDQLLQARSVSLEGTTCQLSFPFFAASAGIKPIERIELCVVGQDGVPAVLEAAGGTAGALLVHEGRGDEAMAGVVDPRRVVWQPVRLAPASVPDLDHLVKNVIASAGTLSVPKRVVADSLPDAAPRLLRLQVRGGERRLFVLLGETSVTLGRQLPSAMDGSDESHIPLRVLPCTTQQQEPINWAHTMQISRVHAELRLVGEGIELLVHGRHGVLLDKRELGEGERAALPEAFWMRLGRGLALRGRVFRPGCDAYMLQIHAARALRKPQLLDAAVRGQVDCVHLTRVLNQTSDEYVILYRSAAIGSSRACPLRFSGEGVTPLHARLLRHRGLLFVTGARGSRGRVEVDGRQLRADEAAPLLPRSILRLGDTIVDVDAVPHAALIA